MCSNFSHLFLKVYQVSKSLKQLLVSSMHSTWVHFILFWEIWGDHNLFSRLSFKRSYRTQLKSTVNSWFKKDLKFKIHLNKAFFSDDWLLDSLHKYFLNQTTLDLGKEKWTFLNREFTLIIVASKIERENYFTSARQQTKMIVTNKLSQWRQLLLHRKTGVLAKSEKKENNYTMFFIHFHFSQI